MFRKIRIGFWIVLLLSVLFGLWQDYRGLQWRQPLTVALYPVNADHSEASADYIRHLQSADFAVVADFFSAQATRYGLTLQRPVEVVLGPSVSTVPPPPPSKGSGLLEIMRWSLSFRWYAWMHRPEVGVPVDIKLYLLYYDVGQHRRLQHSTALSKGRIGRVNLFATHAQHGVNMIVLAHELLHAIHATDKYDADHGEPVFPQGYAEPYAQPLYPQSMAEIMAGRIPFTAQKSSMAPGLERVVIGRQTAREIGWLK